MKYFLFLMVTVSCFGCQSEASVDREMLFGEWIISSALRDNKETTTLDGLIFSFDEQDMTTNLTGEMISTKFRIKGMLIIAENGMEYKVESIESNRLVLSATVRDSKFMFKFNRAENVQ